jgi:ferric-dicitrate binding protein FerR (iron transport regulator)
MSDSHPSPTPAASDLDARLDALTRLVRGGDDSSGAVPLAQHLAAHPADMSLASALRHARTTIEECEREAVIEQRAQLLLAHVDAGVSSNNHAHGIRRPIVARALGTSVRRRAIGVGAIVAVASGIAVVWPELYTAGSSVSNRRVYATASGEVATVTLTDGSRITMAPRTTLDVGAGFGKTTRNVMLQGEAYFEVTGSTVHPFDVRTSRGVHVRVLGTAFGVTNHPDEAVRVAVQSGRVRATTPRGESVVVSEGRVAHLTDSTARETADDVSRYIGWTQGTLAFDDAPVTDVLTTLSHWYGVRFRLADSSLTQVRVTARFNTRSADGAMALLRTLLRVNLSIHRAADTTIVTLRSKDSVATAPLPARNARHEFIPHVEAGR